MVYVCMYLCMYLCRHTGVLQAAMKGLGVAYSDADINKITQRHVREREVHAEGHICCSGLVWHSAMY